jgi:hypothetical protein
LKVNCLQYSFSDLKKLNNLIKEMNEINLQKDKVQNELQRVQMQKRPSMKKNVHTLCIKLEINPLQVQIFESMMIQNIQAIENLEIKAKFEKQAQNNKILHEQIEMLLRQISLRDNKESSSKAEVKMSS